MILRTVDGLQALTTPAAGSGFAESGSVNLYGRRQAYAEIYKSQPNIRICVDFLARNIAMLGLHVFRRVSDTDRVRLVDHELVRWLGRPNRATRRYRLIESLMGDLGIYFDAYWLKGRYRGPDGRPAISLIGVPPEQMAVLGGLLPAIFRWTGSTGRAQDFAPTDFVHFDGYNPLNRLRGLSPLETLRRILAEEAAAGDHREGFWRNAARMDGIVTRPATVKPYTEEQAQDWRRKWQAAYGGGVGAGRTMLLQSGETFTPQSFSAKDSEYSAGRKLSREECAAAFHIPQPMVGILDHATYSNITEQRKMLYTDCLGPWLEMIQQEIEGQLLVECADQTDVYVEFNIADKLKGSFEEQSTSLRMLVGRPIMTANEGRARLNLPSIEDEDANSLAKQQGGPASDGDPVETPTPPAKVATAVRAHWARQQARLAKMTPDEVVVAFDRARWLRELAADLTPLLGDDAGAYAARVTDDTYTLVLQGADPFPATREVRDV